jgi:hypothetical protein
MNRPELRSVAIPNLFLKPEPGTRYITMSPGQWDGVLQSAYDKGWTLVEIDGEGKPLQAFKRNG